jgi:hypothetical protein
MMIVEHLARGDVTIERRGRKGRKESPYFLAAFAAFAFYGSDVRRTRS